MLDLDGTTIQNHPDAMPSQRVREAIAKAQKKVEVCVVTGRFLFQAEKVLDALKITTPTILLGGAQILDEKTHKFIYEQPLESQDVTTILKIIEKYHANTKIREQNHAVYYTPDYTPKKPFIIFVNSVSEEVTDLLADKIVHIPTVTAHKIYSWSPGKFCLNISHATATKQHALFEVAKKLGIETHEMIGVGDGPNDFPLLMACGLKVAMGNAGEDLKAIADYVVPSVDEDGVADVIEKFIL